MRNSHDVEKVKTDLEIEEHLDFHNRGWTAQTFGLLFIYSMIAMGAIGVFGDGPFSDERARGQNSHIRYQNFFRHEAIMPIEVTVLNEQGSEAVISLPGKYLQEFEIQSIVPEPAAVATNGDRVEYAFPGSGNINVTFYLVPQKVGYVDGIMNIEGDSFLLKHFIFP